MRDFIADISGFIQNDVPKAPNKPQQKKATTSTAQNSPEGQKAIERAEKMVVEATDGNKWHSLRKAAYLLGGYIAGGLIDEDIAFNSLKVAIDSRDCDDFEAAYKTIEQGLEDGQEKPITEEDIETNKAEYARVNGYQSSKNQSNQSQESESTTNGNQQTKEEQGNGPSATDNSIYDNIIRISDERIGYGIWLFKINEKKSSGVVKRKIVFDGIYRDGIVSLLVKNGFCKRYRDNLAYIFIRDVNNILEEVEPSIMKDFIFEFVQNIGVPLEFNYEETNVSIEPTELREVFLRQSHLIFNQAFLEHLPSHEKPLLKDTTSVCYLPFKNEIIEITKSGYVGKEYSTLDKSCIWKKHIKQTDYAYRSDNEDSHFARFIKNISNQENDRIKAFKSAIGYLIHNFSNPTQGQAILCYDEEITSLKNPQGGTGKGLLANAVKQVRDTAKIDGKKFDAGDKFCFQEISESTQVAWFDDVKPELGFDRFNSILTDGWNVEKKYKDAFFIKPESSPKVLICSNTILEGEGTTRKRRQFIIEFSNHYSKKIKTGLEQPIIAEHGCTFFSSDWDADEWSKFYSYVVDCVVFFLKNGLSTYQYKNLATNRLRQTTSDEFYQWAMEKSFKPKVVYETKSLFEEFKNIYFKDDDKFKQRGFSNMLKKLANAYDWQMITTVNNGASYVEFQN